MRDEAFSPLSAFLVWALLVGCAWAYPRLNRWVYVRRLARDAADASRQSSNP